VPQFATAVRNPAIPQSSIGKLHEDPSTFAHVSPEEMQAIIQKYTEWKNRMQDSGVLFRGEKLQDGTGRVLRANGGNVTVL
jgi:hypothetical protein